MVDQCSLAYMSQLGPAANDALRRGSTELRLTAGCGRQARGGGVEERGTQEGAATHGENRSGPLRSRLGTGKESGAVELRAGRAQEPCAGATFQGPPLAALGVKKIVDSGHRPSAQGRYVVS